MCSSTKFKLFFLCAGYVRRLRGGVGEGGDELDVKFNLLCFDEVWLLFQFQDLSKPFRDTLYTCFLSLISVCLEHFWLRWVGRGFCATIFMIRAWKGCICHESNCSYLSCKAATDFFTIMQAINVEGLSLDKVLEHQVNNNGWALEKGGKVIILTQLLIWKFIG